MKMRWHWTETFDLETGEMRKSNYIRGMISITCVGVAVGSFGSYGQLANRGSLRKGLGEFDDNRSITDGSL